ncbi:sensor histidine kinase YesM [Chitinophaga terrae (ex Kim and Jung 2007)]|uniref:sensor histidine kinase n=1 Tax=Chitinophaga terrae (ex Kim and Jung 2007) TaxID=408074 RepID=UPI00277ECB36|nr:histidine kinase [Chitinophaga terrae (ex Kim and Jung 2007)]MDQ0108888.1 sensor histidine kinase YesM [Chitinophaga terrae (ex Kim and Jung 2007)]
MKKEWYQQKWVIFARHALAWLILFSLPYLLKPSIDHEEHNRVDEKHLWEIYVYCAFIFLIIFFYFNAWVLVPRYVYKKKIAKFLAFVLGILAFMCLSRYGFEKLALKPHEIDIKPIILFEFFIFISILSASTAYKMIDDKVVQERQNSARENENLKTELSLLRSQVSPHFMFNVLNNMVSLARKRSDLLEPSLIKLSSLMRYMLYEADEEKVPLHREIEYLQSYIDLQQQRFGKNVQINVSLNAGNDNFEIEPMLLIPFVENAFKHGTGMIMNAAIDIELKTRDKMLFFSVRNKYDETSGEIKDKTSGIGLNNVKRRLNLLYGNEHLLQINRQDGCFIVSLQLNLH